MRNLAEETVFNHSSINTFIHLGGPVCFQAEGLSQRGAPPGPQVPAVAGLDWDVAVETTSPAPCRLALVGAEQPRGRARHRLTPPGVDPD